MSNLAIINLSRFPMHFDENLWLKGVNSFIWIPFKKYVKELQQTTKIPSTIFFNLPQTKFTRRMILGNEAINPDLQQHEHLIKRVYVYPEKRFQETQQDAYVLGYRIKLQKVMFIPLITLRALNEQEVRAFKNITEKTTVSFGDMLDLIKNLGIEIQREIGIPGTTPKFALKLLDPEIENNEPFWILISRNGLFLDTNVCYTPHSQIYFYEALLDFREHRYLHIYPEYNYTWISD